MPNERPHWSARDEIGQRTARQVAQVIRDPGDSAAGRKVAAFRAAYLDDERIEAVGRMRYLRFLFYSFAGSVLWIGSLLYGGYYFGNLPFVKQNLGLFIIGIVVLSIMPGVIEYWRHRSGATKRA